MSVIIPTRDRTEALTRTLRSLLASTEVPEEFVIVDASSGTEAADVAETLFAVHQDAPRLVLRRAAEAGAASQRNEAVALATCDYVLFCDDDIVCEPECLARLWQAMRSDGRIGGINASIVNQTYVRPGFVTRGVLSLMGLTERDGYAGRVVGPAINFLPRADVTTEAVTVDWLNLSCTLYRRGLLPDPPFDRFFTGYSYAEDLTLSLRVARRAKLANAPAARVYHDSQPGAHKSSLVELSRMHLVNRHYVMTRVMGRSAPADKARLILWECYQIAVSAVRERLGRRFWQVLRGRLLGAGDLLRSRVGEPAA